VMTGSTELGRPPLGSCSYGPEANRKAFPRSWCLAQAWDPSAGSHIWSNGLMPSVYQGTRLANTGDRISYPSSPAGISRKLQSARWTPCDC
jgi:Protein of unknown function (DUF1501)